MSRVRVALVGLSASAVTSWAAEGHLPYLLSERGRAKYEIVALLNSSSERAELAKDHFHLPSTVKTYGRPEQVANDPSIDLVIVNTRVDVHFDSVLHSARAGKAVYVEWPLAQSLRHAAELSNACVDPKESIIGLQARVSPVMDKVKALLAQNAIGAVLSSNVQAFGSLLSRDSLSEGMAYFAQRYVGGNAANISFGHMIDAVHNVLGEFRTFNTLMQVQRPKLEIVDGKGTKTGSVSSDVPDLISITGTIDTGSATAPVAKGAILTAYHRTGPPFPGSPGFTWTINGEIGEIRVCAPGAYLQFDNASGPVTIEHHDFASDKVSQVEWDWQDWQKDLPIRTRNVAELYERYAAWKLNDKSANPKGIPAAARWPNLEDAVGRHRQIFEMYRSWDPTIAA